MSQRKPKPDVPLPAAVLAALAHFEALDRANAAIHCAEVRYSPITFMMAEALDAVADYEELALVRDVLSHTGRYPLDPGR